MTGLLSFAKLKLGISPAEFWQMTFGEFWPLYNQVMGNVILPLSHMELEALEDRWTNGNT